MLLFVFLFFPHIWSSLLGIYFLCFHYKVFLNFCHATQLNLWAFNIFNNSPIYFIHLYTQKMHNILFKITHTHTNTHTHKHTTRTHHTHTTHTHTLRPTLQHTMGHNSSIPIEIRSLYCAFSFVVTASNVHTTWCPVTTYSRLNAVTNLVWLVCIWVCLLVSVCRTANRN